MASQQRPGESLTQFAIRAAWEAGHFWPAEVNEGRIINQDMLAGLKPSDDIVVRAFRSFTRMDPERYQRHGMETLGRPPEHDGTLGPATTSMIVHNAERCPVPDFAPPAGLAFHFDDQDLQRVVERMQADAATAAATGSGNWKGCHGNPNGHTAIMRWDQRNLPDFLQPVFREVLARVQAAYAATGVLFRFVDTRMVDILTGEQLTGTVEADLSFVLSSDGWIGLAIVGNGLTCGKTVWGKFLATYRGGNTTEQVVAQWTTLVKHEIGHITGRLHTSGGVMNPSIINGLPWNWPDDDPTTRWLRQQFGGVPMPIPGGGGGTTTTPAPVPPMEDLRKQVANLSAEVMAQTAAIQWLKIQRDKQVAQITDLGQRVLELEGLRG